MYKLAPLLCLLLAACGMKGDLYEPATEPATDETAKSERTTLPPPPDPALSQ